MSSGATPLLVNISSSPYYAGKGMARERMLATRAADNVAVVAFCNLVGGQDELIFDGGSVIFDERGELVARGAQFEYVHKNGFRHVTIALSGGVDSSLVACIAADALGPENVTGVAMPSRYSAEFSQTDAARLAESLGIHFLVIPIERVFQAYLDTLAAPFARQEPDVTEENLQARIRGNLLMALCTGSHPACLRGGGCQPG